MRQGPGGARDAGGAKDAGTSLVELSIAMLIGAIVLTAVVALALTVNRSTTDIRSSTTTTSDARVASESLNRLLRVAVPPSAGTPALVTAKSDSISFYANVDRSGGTSTTNVVPTLVAFAWNGTCLNRTLTPGPAYTTGATTCVVRTSVAPAFGYYASTDPAATALTVPASGLTSAVAATVVAVQTTLTAGTAATSTRGNSVAQVVDKVVLTNVLAQATP